MNLDDFFLSACVGIMAAGLSLLFYPHRIGQAMVAGGACAALTLICLAAFLDE